MRRRRKILVPSRVVRRVVGVEVAPDRRWLDVPPVSRLCWQRRHAVGSVASMRSMRWLEAQRRSRRRKNARPRSAARHWQRVRTHPRLGSSGRRTLVVSFQQRSRPIVSGSARFGRAPSRASASAERRSLASKLCAWARRNSDQLGPIRRGAGPRPALRNTVAIVFAETPIPSPFSSPWMRT